MKHIKTFEKVSSDIKKLLNTNGDVYYRNKDDYNYPDGFNRYFKRGYIVILIKDSGYTDFNIGDKFKILRMEGQNAKVKNLRNNKKGVISLGSLLSEKDLEDYEKYIILSNDINKYNL